MRDFVGNDRNTIRRPIDLKIGSGYTLLRIFCPTEAQAKMIRPSTRKQHLTDRYCESGALAPYCDALVK